MRILEAFLSSFFKRGFKPLFARFLYNVSYTFVIDLPSQIFIAYVRISLLP